MPRYKIRIEYDGTNFVGWQRQAEGRSIQGAIEAAVEKFSGDRVSLRGAGRTDSGVHALGQVAHFDLTKQWDAFRVGEALNFHLKPDPIGILKCEAVDDAFDARFSATQRHYLYRILVRRAPPVLDRNRVWWLTSELDVAAMENAAPVLVGHHDFTTFRAGQCQAKSPLKTVDALSISATDAEIHIRVAARSFLHNQVRSMVGALKRVGEGAMTRADLAAALDARNRSACPAMAPSAGLYLGDVIYDPVPTVALQ